MSATPDERDVARANWPSGQDEQRAHQYSEEARKSCHADPLFGGHAGIDRAFDVVRASLPYQFAAVRAEGREKGLEETCGLRDAILDMMTHRGWSTDWIHRSAYLHLEAAELAEAVRGKRGETLDESADVLITLLALSPHGLAEIVAAASKKVARLRSAPPYPGEEAIRALKAKPAEEE